MKALISTYAIVLLSFSGCWTHASEQELVKKDLDVIQGTWKVVGLEAEGQQAPADIVAALKLVFKEDALTVTPGEPGFTNYKFKINATSKPATFEMTHADGPDKGQTQKGIYWLDGDRLKICLGSADQTPNEFTTKPKSGHAMYTLEREKNAAQSEIDKLQGTWKLVYQEMDGSKLPDEKDAEMFHGQMVFKGNEIRYTVELPGFDFNIAYKLQSEQRPRAIDLEMKADGDKQKAGLKTYGIYLLEGDTLKICHSKVRRPTEFEAAKGSDNVLIVLKKASVGK